MGISTNAGFSLNGPVIYPNSKKKPTVESPKPADESVSVSRQTTSSTPQRSQSTSAPASSPSTQQTAASNQASDTSATAVSRPMGADDIAAQLAKIGQPSTPANQHLASQMTQYGVPLSSENFQEILRQLKGRSGQDAVEASVVSLLKGLTGLGRSVDVLTPYFSNQLSIDQPTQQLMAALSRFQAALNSATGSFDGSFLNQLGSIIAQLKDDVKRYRDATQSRPDSHGLTRGLLSLSQFLNGLEQQWLSRNPNKSGDFHASLTDLKQSSYDFIDSQLAQSVLSHPDKQPTTNDRFFYWMLPNTMNPDHNIDVLIRKDNGVVNPEKTRIIVKLDTPDLGEITVIIDIIDKLVWYTVNADRAATKAALLAQRDELANQLATLKFTLRDMRFSDKTVDIKQLLLPQSNLDDVVRIEVEA